jgi:hypothetical protein
MRTDLIEPSDPLWMRTLESVAHDVYHLPSYVELCAGMEGGVARAFVASEGDCAFLVPLIVRDIPERLGGGDLRDATVPYGYPGPIASCAETRPDAPAEFVSRAVFAMAESLREQRVISAFLRLHPLLPVPLEGLGQLGGLVPSGDTVSIDLSLPDEERWRQMRSNHRRDVTKATAQGQVADVDAAWTALPDFIGAYHETMRRVGANSYYMFSEDYFSALIGALGQHAHLWTVRSGPEVLAGAIFTECNGIVQYHLGGTRDRYLPGNPIKLLFHRAAAWFKQRGNRWLHLGGGVGGQHDSLFHFKLGFSSLTFPFHTWRVVLEPTTYDRLSTSAGIQAARDTVTTFFPAYRQLTRV